jgi:hypothetical protein
MYYTTRMGDMCCATFLAEGHKSSVLPCKADMKEVSEALSAAITVQEYNPP